MKPKELLAQGHLKPGQMNNTEARYAERLELMRQSGLLLMWKFEALKLRLADNTFYSPDFLVVSKDGVLECHEVKTFWMDDARVKIKVAADLYPFRFLAVKPKPKKAGGGWDVEYF